MDHLLKTAIRIEDENNKIKKINNSLKKYTAHLIDCKKTKLNETNTKCTCGLDKILDQD